jgi:hypothetical protein
MFNNKLQMNSVAEAVKKVMDEADLDETGFHKAAHAAAKQGLPHFMFQGKKYQTTAKSKPETTQKKMKEENEVETSYTFKDKLIQSLKENKATGTEELFTDNNIGEMSDAQMKRREKIVMGMKDKQADFKKKYGARWKDVMYATATKMAMKEEGDCVTPPEAKKIAKKEVKGHEKSMHHKEEIEIQESLALIEDIEIINEVSLGAKIRAFADHSRYSYEEGDMGNEEASEHHAQRAHKIIQNILRHHGKEAARNAHKAADAHTFGREFQKNWWNEETEELDEKRGVSVRGDKEKEATDSAQQVLDYMKSGGRIKTQPKSTRKPRKIMKHTDLGRTYKSGYGEEVETEEEVLDETIDPKDKTVDMLRGRVKVSPNYDNEHKSYKVKLSAEDMMGDTGWVPKKEPQTDKSGATHTPISRARMLAQKAFQRTKKK